MIRLRSRHEQDAPLAARLTRTQQIGLLVMLAVLAALALARALAAR